MVTAWRRKKLSSLLGNLNSIVKKQQALPVSTTEHVQPRNVMQETKTSNICASESCPIYATFVHMHPPPFLLSFS